MITVSVLLDSVDKVQDFIGRLSKYSCDFDIQSHNNSIDARSLVGLLSLDISNPLHLSFNASEMQTEDILRDLEVYMA